MKQGFLVGKNGAKSSKRLAGLMLIFTACTGTFDIIHMGLPEFIPLVIGIATIGAGLLGSTMVEKETSNGNKLD